MLQVELHRLVDGVQRVEVLATGLFTFLQYASDIMGLVAIRRHKASKGEELRIRIVQDRHVTVLATGLHHFLQVRSCWYAERFWYTSMFVHGLEYICLLYTSPSPRDGLLSRMPSSA